MELSDIIWAGATNREIVKRWNVDVYMAGPRRMYSACVTHRPILSSRENKLVINRRVCHARCPSSIERTNIVEDGVQLANAFFILYVMSILYRSPN